MTFAALASRYTDSGFTPEQAEIIVLMNQAAGCLFREFPESFVLFGGATLILFHNSVRHSVDIDLLSRTDKLPSAEAIIECFGRGLQPAAEAFRRGALKFAVELSGEIQLKISVISNSGRRLFRLDVSRYGPVIESEIEQHAIDIGSEVVPHIRTPSKNFLLLQKAEAFLLRRGGVRARDAYDVHLLLSLGARLSSALTDHLHDSLVIHEIEADQIRERISQVEARRCRHDLKDILPAATYDRFERRNFQELRDSLELLYEPWLGRRLGEV